MARGLVRRDYGWGSQRDHSAGCRGRHAGALDAAQRVPPGDGWPMRIDLKIGKFATELVLWETAALEAYDGFGTFTVAPSHEKNKRGEDVRLAAIMARDLTWQTGRLRERAPRRRGSSPGERVLLPEGVRTDRPPARARLEV
jgi:hypothetical protein